MDRFNSLMLLSICISFVMCSASFADIPSEQRGKLDRMLSEVRVEGSIVQEKDQSDAVKAAASYISKRIHSLGLKRQDFQLWFFALKDVAEGTSPLEVVRWRANPDLEISEEPIADFKNRQARYSSQVSLIVALTHYLKGRFPIEPEGGGSCAMEVDATTPSQAFKGLVPLVAVVTDEMMHVEKAQHSGKAPHFTAKQLFTDIALLDHFDGLDVHMEGVKVLRGNLEEGYRSGPGGELMVALEGPVLGLTPMSALNAEPVRLTSSKASQAFFKGLPSEMMGTNGEWEGYRVDLDRSEFIYTGIYKDSESRAVVPFFFMKRVKAGEPPSALNADLESGKLERAAREKSIQHDMMQAALQLSRGTDWDFPMAEAIHNYLVLYPDFGKAEGDAAARVQYDRIDLEISRLSREHARKVEEYVVQKKAKSDEKRKELFPPAWRERATPVEIRERERTLNRTVSNLMAPLGRELDGLESSLIERRMGQIERRLPPRSPAARARFLLTDVADRGVPLAQYKLAEMYKDGVGGPEDEIERKHYAQLAVNQGLPKVEATPEWMTNPMGRMPMGGMNMMGMNPMGGRWADVPLAAGAAMEQEQVTPDGRSRAQVLMTGNAPVQGGAGISSRVVQVVPPRSRRDYHRQAFDSNGHAGPLSPIQEGSPDFNRVSREFSGLGPMHRLGNYIMSAVGPAFNTLDEAVAFCVSHGGDIPSPTAWELITLNIREHRTGISGDYDPDLVPGLKDKTLWRNASTEENKINGTTGVTFEGEVNSPPHAWCVKRAQLESVVAAPARLVGPHLVTEGSEDYRRVPAAFAAIGPMYRIGNYILSANGPVFANLMEAMNYCESKGGELPIWVEWDGMRNEIESTSPNRSYDPDLVAGLRGSTIWVQSAKVSGTTGLRIDEESPAYSEPTTARCVVRLGGATVMPGGMNMMGMNPMMGGMMMMGMNPGFGQQPAVPLAPGAVGAPPPESVATSAVRPAGPPVRVTEGSEDYRRVPAAFAAIGPMHRIGNYILSANGPVFPDIMGAIAYCRSKGSDVPRWIEWDAIQKEIENASPNRSYDPDLVAGLRGSTLWVQYVKVSGTTGLKIDYASPAYSEPTIARCVVPLNAAPTSPRSEHIERRMEVNRDGGRVLRGGSDH